ncbi:MAG: TIGR03621 family F420-dependent LLM class oxidoreductase [Chloroflexi bacterium]|nr:TIGR03621 family F420-dependent LLM class oxidoreductase [Chloroflexota bacterium]
MSRPFRFGIVSGGAPSGEAWLAKARRVEQLGYDGLLMPDRFGPLLAPIPALAAAAAVTERLILGTFVLAAGLRNPAVLARDAAALQLLSGGRFELGLGSGVSDADYRQAGVAFGSSGERLERLGEEVRAVKAALAGSPNPPRMLLAVSGQRAAALAAQEADVVTIGVPGNFDDATLAQRVEWLRSAAGSRFDEIELAINLLAVLPDGKALPATAQRAQALFKVDLEELARNGSPFIVSGSASDMAAQVRALRERHRLSRVSLPEESMEAFAPAAALLRG